jgi:hypothetical protein
MSRTPEAPPGIRPEAELLLRLARVAPDDATTERVRSLLRGELDWAHLLRVAEMHGTAPLVYWHLDRVAPQSVPAHALDSLRQRFLDNARHNLRLTAELLELLRLFAAHGVRAVPFKGPTLAAIAYGNLALRQFNDLDLLLAPADLTRGRALLAAAGYRSGLPLAPAQEAAYLTSIGQMPFVKEGAGILVELHATIMPRDFRFPLGLARLWPRLRPMSLAGREVYAPCGEDLLLILCAHGAKHAWVCLGWVCDVAELLRASPAMDWPAVTGMARALRCERTLWLGLLLAHDLLQAPVPAELVRRARSSPAVRWLSAQVRRQVFRAARGRWGSLSDALFQLYARERMGDGLRYAVSLALAPTVADWTGARLPGCLAFLYYLVRPGRLAAKYGRLALRRR